MKRMIATILLMVLAFGFTGCGSAAVSSSFSSNSMESSSSSASSESSSQISEVFDPTEHTLAICMGSITHPVYRIVQLGFIESAEKLGYKNIPVSGLVEGSMAELIEKWNSDVVKNGVDGIVMWTGDDSCYTALKSWHYQGIKTVVPYFMHSYRDTRQFIDANPAENLYAMGVAAADLLVETLGERGITVGAIGLSINGSGVIDNSHQIGFLDRLKELESNFTILDYIFEGAEKDEAAEKITAYISENPDIVGAFGGTTGSALSWSRGKAATNRQDIIVVAMNYTTGNLDLLKSGEVDALVAEPLYTGGYEGAVMLDELLRGTVFEESEWNRALESHIITADGTGKNGLDYYYDLYARCDALDWDKYLT